VITLAEMIDPRKAGAMRLRFIVISILLVAISPLLAAQRIARVKRVRPTAQEPALVTSSQSDKAMANILAVTPNLPRGPQELLQDYRNQMTLVSETLSTELGVISQAVQNGQIKRADAEYLIQQRYQLALMQYQVFSALHDSLEFEITRISDAAARAQNSCRSDAVVVVQGQPPLSCGPINSTAQ